MSCKAIVGGCTLVLFLYVAEFCAEEDSDMTFTFKINATGTQYELHRELVIWRQAAMRCAATGGELWVPGGEAEQRAVRGEAGRVADSAIWTGLHFRDTTVYRDPDGHPVSEVPKRYWCDGQPDTTDGARLCVVLQADSSLFVDYCDRNYYYLCKFLAGSEHTDPKYDKIPWGAKVKFNIKQNYVYHKEKATYAQAKERCAYSGAQLLGLADEEEARVVMAVVKTVDPRWGVWAGHVDRLASDLNSQIFMPFNAIPNIQPPSRKRIVQRRCVALRSESSKFDADCEWPGPYVCRFPATTKRVKNVTITTDGTDILYQYNNEWVSWQEARDRCSAAGARLWAPEDEAEARPVMSEANAFIEGSPIWTNTKELDSSGASKYLKVLPLAGQLKWDNEDQLTAPEADTRRCVLLKYELMAYNKLVLSNSNCEENNAYVCKLSLASITPALPASLSYLSNATTPRINKPATILRSDKPATTPRIYKPATILRSNKPATTPRIYKPATTPRINKLATILRSDKPATIYKPATTPRINKAVTILRSDKPATTPRIYKPATTPRINKPATILRSDKSATTPRIYKPATTPRINKPATILRSDKPATTPRIYKPATTPRINKPATILRSDKPATTPRIYKPATTPRSNKPSTTPIIYKPTTVLRSDKPAMTPRSYKPATTLRSYKPATTPSSDKLTTTLRSDKPANTPRINKPTTTPHSDKPATTLHNNKTATTPRSDDPNKLLNELPWGGKMKFTIQQNKFVFVKKEEDWFKARDLCSFVDAQLWAPADEDEAKAVMAKLNSVIPGYYIWTSINDLNTSGAYQTLDGRPLSSIYNKWYDGELKSNSGAWRCVVLRPDYSLYVYECDLPRPYVCMYPEANKSHSSDILPWGGNMNFTVQQNSYMFIKKEETWYQARDRCLFEEAQLWAPEDDAEAAAVMAEMDRVIPGYWIWTSISDLDTSGVFQTLDSRPLNTIYNKWYNGEMRLNGGAWRCVVLRQDHLLYVYKCDWPRPYVCKYLAASALAPTL